MKTDIGLDEKIAEVKKAVASVGIMTKVELLAIQAGLSVEEAYQYVKLLQKMHQICMTVETLRLTEAIE